MKGYGYFTTVVSYILKSQKRKLIQLSYRLKDKVGLEIGGPSSSFDLKSYFPVYLFAKQVDGVNFSNETVWEGKIEAGPNYKYSKDKKGYQFIGEASNLANIDSNKYGFVLSCHSLEHVANPVKALKEWFRVLKPGGTIVLILPDKEHTFDHNRPYTTLEHLKEDYSNNIDEHDETHFEEVNALHDLSLDAGVKDITELKERTKNNFINRCIHHHVYSLDLLENLLTYCGFKTTYKQKAAPFHLIILAQK